MTYNLLTSTTRHANYNSRGLALEKTELVRKGTSFGLSASDRKALFLLPFFLVRVVGIDYHVHKCGRLARNLRRAQLMKIFAGRSFDESPGYWLRPEGRQVLGAYKAKKATRNMLLHMVLMAVLSPAAALADPNIQLNMSVAKQVTVEEKGQKVTRWVDAKDIEPGQKLKYTVHYSNVGDEPATKVRIENPIPELTVYVSDSASGKGTTIVFSADGGKTYEKQGEVTYDAKLFGGGTERRKAGPEQYTNIRWQIDRIPPGGTGDVSFIVNVK